MKILLPFSTVLSMEETLKMLYTLMPFCCPLLDLSGRLLSYGRQTTRRAEMEAPLKNAIAGPRQERERGRLRSSGLACRISSDVLRVFHEDLLSQSYKASKDGAGQTRHRNSSTERRERVAKQSPAFLP